MLIYPIPTTRPSSSPTSTRRRGTGLLSSQSGRVPLATPGAGAWARDTRGSALTQARSTACRRSPCRVRRRCGDRFNAADRSLHWNLADVVAEATWRVTGQLRVTAGLARKQRAPAYQELYLWLPVQATARPRRRQQLRWQPQPRCRNGPGCRTRLRLEKRRQPSGAQDLLQARRRLHPGHAVYRPGSHRRQLDERRS
jgi:hypothetical protein